MTVRPINCDSSSRKVINDTLVRRVNELYHDFQSHEFDEVHLLRHRAEQVFWTKHALPHLIKLGNHSRGLDLCTGTGFVPMLILSKLPGSTSMTCVDISSKALAETQRRLGRLAQSVTCIAGDVGELNVADSSFDWVTMNAALHHMPDPEKVLREVDRILKPGGCFCLGHEPNVRFFRSHMLVGLERVIWHSFWYLSPRQNLRRLRGRFGVHAASYEQREHLDEICQTLIDEGLIDKSLTRAEMRKLVDVHTSSDDDSDNEAGFDAAHLIETAFSNYQVHSFIQSDYGGEMMRKSMIARGLYDRIMAFVAPGRGRLVSFVIQKPGRSLGE